MTTAQLATLKADILADGTLNALPANSDGAVAIAAIYNIAASPDFWTWRTAVTKSELVTSIGPDGTTFNWTANGFITRSQGEIAAWIEMFNADQIVNPSLANVRQAIADIFSGTGNAAANRTHLIAVSRRKMSRVEKLFATGTGSTASPATLGFEGPLLYQDVDTARNS